MKKRILSILLCFCMAISLLPTTALAAGPSVTIGDVSLTSSKYYTVSGTTVTELDSAPDSGGYLYYTLDGTNATLAVTGDVTFTKAAGQINPILLITGCTLTLTGSGNLTLSATRGSAVYGDDGSLVTNDYTGNINFTTEPTSASGSAVYGCADLRLITSGALTLSGGSTGSGVYHCSGDITLEGDAVSLTGGGYLAQSTTGNVSITAETGDLLLSGSGSLPLLEAGSSGTGNVTLSVPNGAISVKNTGSGVAVNGNLSADAGGDVTVESTGHHAVVGNASISADGNVAITSGSSDAHSAVTGALTVTKAACVTVTSAGSNPTIVDATGITADGDISIKNTGSGMAIGNTLTATSTNGSVTVEGKHASAPAIAGITTITAAKDITITSASTLDIGGTATLNAPNGMVIRSTSVGSTVTTGDGGSYAYGGDVETDGLNISGKDASGNADATYNAPAEVTRYKAGNGYILYTPAVTGDNAANAKLELHDATINTTNATGISLPSDAPVDIVVASDSSITAGGSGNVINTNGQELSVIGEGNLTLAGPYYGINGNGNGLVNIDLAGDLTFDTGAQPISTSGNVNVSAKSILSKTGYYFSGSNVSLTATDGDISLTTKGSYSGAVSGMGGVSLLASKGAVTINHADNAQGGYALNGSEVKVSALKDVTITTSRGGISASSGEVSVSSTTGSIEMDCAMDQCVSAGGTVVLNAPKDVTLNDSGEYSTAVSASGKDVYLTVGGTLTSTSAYGFQTGALTINANEVSIEGTTQDGIQASSVSITNTDGTSNCESVSITATSSSDSWAAIHALGSTDTGNITIKADDVFICGKGSAKAISALGTVTIGDAGLIVGAISVSDTSGIDSDIVCAANGGEISGKLDLTIDTPTIITYYEVANNCYIIFAPKSGDDNAVLTLHDVNNIGYLMDGTILPDTPITLKLEGANYFSQISASDNILISGNGLLYSVIKNSTASAVMTVGSGVTLNAMYQTTANGVTDNTIYGTYHCSSTISPTTKLKLNPGAVLTLAYGNFLEFKEGATLDYMTIGTGASIVNNTYITLPKDTTAAQIAALPLSGNGVVRVTKTYGSNGSAETWDTYTNDGTSLTVIGDGTTGLDLANDSHSGKTVANDGYSWDATSHTLTLGNRAYVGGGLTLPTDAPVTINSDSSIISGTIGGDGNAALRLAFSGTAPLTINGGINDGINGDTVTVQGGAQVTLNGYISLGGSGTGSMLNVTGAGTALNITSDSAYGAICDTVNVQNGAALTVHTEGADTRGVEALSGGVSVTGGSTLTVGCDYGVYIIGGKLTVDSTSKLITNGAVAPFCIVGAANSTQGDVLSLAGDLPSGTEIASRQATNSSGLHTYWSLVPTNGNLTVSDTDNTPVTLTGAATGKFTFAKAASTPTGGGSGSTSYTLTFETNGGSKISSVSKTSGTAVSLSDYKTTRDGYTFAGWCSDSALTNRITSVTLTKSTTVYAKWTEKSANPFADVSDSAYYHDAVLWAMKNGVTGGKSDTAFSPDITCTRAQMVTFLWRAVGSPEPASTNCPFTDVSKDAYYFKAVLWAVEKGVTAGTSATTFGSDDIVTRGQAVTFLWRAAGKPEETSANPFSDVTKDAYYYDAVLWAMKKGITQGTSATSFSPENACTRAQIVTFLYRYAGE